MHHHRIRETPGLRNRATRTVLLIAGTVLLAACAVQQAPRAEKALPDAGAFRGGGDADPAVCERLGGESLQALIHKAFADSPTLAQSRARLRQARAASRAQSATLLPSLSLSMERSDTKVDGEDAGGTAGALTGARPGSVGTSVPWQAAAAASYEVDFWGRLDSRREAARLSAWAAEAELRTAALTLASDIATAWAEWISAVRRTSTLAAQRESADALARLQARRFGQGQADALALMQARQEAASVASRLSAARGAAENARVRLAALLGRTPGEVSFEPPAGLPVEDKLPAPGLPSDLLTARPDLRAAWLRLRSADAEAAAAAAERWPRLTLTANLFYQSRELENLFDEAIRQTAAALDWTVFSGGRLSARQAEAEARALERLYALKQAWIQALAEVQTALDAERAAQRRAADLRQRLHHARERLKLAYRRYARGQTAYLEVLSAQQAVNGAELDLIDALNAGFVQRVNLCRGLAASVAGPLPEPAPIGAKREDSR